MSCLSYFYLFILLWFILFSQHSMLLRRDISEILVHTISKKNIIIFENEKKTIFPLLKPVIRDQLSDRSATGFISPTVNMFTIFTMYMRLLKNKKIYVDGNIYYFFMFFFSLIAGAKNNFIPFLEHFLHMIFFFVILVYNNNNNKIHL